MCERRIEILPNIFNVLIKISKDLKITPKQWNIAKSGYTDSKEVVIKNCFVWL